MRVTYDLELDEVRPVLVRFAMQVFELEEKVAIERVETYLHQVEQTARWIAVREARQALGLPAAESEPELSVEELEILNELKRLDRILRRRPDHLRYLLRGGR